MGIILTPASENRCAYIRLIISISVFQEKECWRFTNNNATIGEDKAGRNVKLVGEDGELVCFAVPIGVL